MPCHLLTPLLTFLLFALLSLTLTAPLTFLLFALFSLLPSSLISLLPFPLPFAQAAGSRCPSPPHSGRMRGTGL